MNPETLLKVLFAATGANTDEEKARVAWRFCDAMWDTFGTPGGVSIPVCRHFNNLLQDQKWPWVKNLWSKDEVVARLKAKGASDEMIATLVPTE